MKSFPDYKAFHQLQELAKNPIDLTNPKNFTAERLKKYSLSSCDYQLLYGMESVTDEVMKTLYNLADESHALEKMLKMQSGAIVNYIENFPSENRPALHTATRDFFSNPIEAEPAKKAAVLAMREVKKLKQFMHKIDTEKSFSDLIMIGIGGSDLGPRAHYIALQYLLKPSRSVHFIANVDPDDAADVLRQVTLSKTLVLVVSKTGTTLETATNEMWMRQAFLDQNLDPRLHMVSITMPGTPMDDKNKYLECFHIWDWVGGRYSTTSMVGGVLLSFAFGFEVFWEFLQGANAMDKTVLDDAGKKSLPLLAALIGIWNRNFLKHQTLAIIPYSQALLRFPAHIQQLDMESNGKSILQSGKPVTFETGPIIWGEIGTNAQHSFFQLLHQGTTIVPLEFIGFKESQQKIDFSYKETDSQQKLLANLFAQTIALATGQEAKNRNQYFSGNRPSHLIFGERLSPFSLGSLLAFYEHKTVFQGFIWGINSFDQEGVQLGKKIAGQILERFAHPEKQLDIPLADALMAQLEV